MAQQYPAPSHPAATPEAKSVNWWLRLTSYGWDKPAKTLQERELIRRSQLASWVILTLLIVDAILVPVGLSDVSTLIAVLVGGAGFLFAAFLNRRGQVNVAGGFLIVLICAAILGAIVGQSQGLLLDLMPTYDLFVMAVLVAASILPPRSAFVVAAITSALICLDFFLQPHAGDLTADLKTYPSVVEGTITLLARPIALQILVATIAFLWVRGTERAIARADRAEEVAALEHALAEKKLQLEAGVQEIEKVLVRVANGQYTTRVPSIQEEQLWRIGLALNNLLNRLQRAAQSEHEYQRTVTEIQRLVLSIEAARKGSPPMWPPRSGTPVDLIIDQINDDRRRDDGSRLRPPKS